MVRADSLMGFKWWGDELIGDGWVGVGDGFQFHTGVLRDFVLLFSIFRFFVKLKLTCEFDVLIDEVVY
jgi:hypothetical protein